jgi:hypothetical protein
LRRRRLTYLFLPNDARVKPLASEKGAEFFVITLPMLADLAALQRGTDAVRARENVS